MNWSRWLLICVVLITLVESAPAGLFSKKQPRPKPEECVPQLIATVKTDQDEHKRAAAATELRHFDPKAFPDIVPILADVLRNDAKASVRLEAAQSLARLRPVSVDAGMALEHAAANDASLRVRMQARTSLIYYRLSGYHSPKKDQAPVLPNGTDKGEPPLAPPDVATKGGRMPLLPRPSGPMLVPTTTGEPPLAQSLPDNAVARPLPAGPAKSRLVPAPRPRLQPPPPAAPEQGPDLNP